MRDETVQTDITVIGGGLAGVCAAVAAARLGRTVALVHNRAVLGGNSSSEVRVWVCGATSHGKNRYARESGIMGEMFAENQYRNPDGNPYLWDLVVLETVKAEPNIRLFLNTDVHETEATGPEEERRIASVTGWMMGSERRIRFESAFFLDCTGDGLVGFLAGARYRIGREAKHEYGEEWAPDTADDITLGSTILFYTKDAGHPVRFVPPSFAKDIAKTSIPMRRVIRSGDSGCHYWWIEWGGELDTVHDNERIRDELWSAIYGIWDYIKNSGRFEAERMTLEWVGALPGKREYRRFVGDYVLNQRDIMRQEPFADRIAFGGWSIDLHPPQGMYAGESGSKHMYADGVYHIPFRSLYSANVANLLFAGRNISASHVAFGTTRVMATCAVIGEAAGSGAALCAELGMTPSELAQGRMTELQQLMLKQDASIIGLRSEDAADLARQAKAEASSALRRLAAEEADSEYPLASDVGQLIPIDPKLNGLELLLSASEPTALQVEVWDTGRAENYVPRARKAEVLVNVPNGEKQWLPIPIAWEPGEAQNAFLIVRANDRITLYPSASPVTGVLPFYSDQVDEQARGSITDGKPQPLLDWEMNRMGRRPFCFRIAGESNVFAAERIVDGYHRPYGQPHLWVSEPMQDGREEWVSLTWAEPVSIREIRLTFNDDLNEDLINLHHHRTPFDVMPELVKDYRIEAWQEASWRTIAAERNNRKRHRVHRLPKPIEASRLRVVVESTNGGKRAEIVEVRVYG
ncbi:FAD-dependent oxidoreductase [Paenibacillus methanolicus]|uniref:FAD dependent oxidoreductase n=1 Tax=Paenibacillus methanolicus TaxID=582686 RepID=A0A5S5CK76_9BACL|nr:FAD-dependent oxidoreductase [Paenibacillus methanolicus]TYP79135.1 FAD dependent oxidoreductase [Paenibacillus methanolicus]